MNGKAEHFIVFFSNTRKKHSVNINIYFMLDFFPTFHHISVNTLTQTQMFDFTEVVEIIWQLLLGAECCWNNRHIYNLYTIALSNAFYTRHALSFSVWSTGEKREERWGACLSAFP